MPLSNQWHRANISRASLLERAIVEAHNYYGVYEIWKAQGNTLGRKSPIPVVKRFNETPDQFEADFKRHIHPHRDVMKQRSQQINFAQHRVKEIIGGSVPRLRLTTQLLLVHSRLAKIFQLVLLFVGSNQGGYVSTEGINRFPKVETLRVTSLLDEDLIPLLYGVLGKQPSNMEALISTCIHKCRRHPIGVAISPT